MTTDISVAPEIAMLAEPRVPAGPRGQAEPMMLVAAPSAAPPHHLTAPDANATAAPPWTLGALAGLLRSIAATPERWWGLVCFDPGRSVKIMIEESASHQAWLVVLPPGDAGHGCGCDVITMIAGEAIEGAPRSAVLRPGPVRVHGKKHPENHVLHGRGPGYSISLHARCAPAGRREVIG